ncbi:hypothetical protein CDAR_2051 [Caerostris darwini]|uniref:Uncharacterized protein n=1 Tax=Caerostris darwini TaxID=1538125 RepID=A0AAV4VX69_9ARAC|nr:hypothetical protein CDAR_2051 [Caerostris darwini]
MTQGPVLIKKRQHNVQHRTRVWGGSSSSQSLLAEQQQPKRVPANDPINNSNPLKRIRLCHRILYEYLVSLAHAKENKIFPKGYFSHDFRRYDKSIGASTAPRIRKQRLTFS